VERGEELYRRCYVDARYRGWLEDMNARASGIERRKAGNLTLGYVTNNSCPGVGEDTRDTPLPYYSIPDFIGSSPPSVPDDTPFDLVFVDFIQTQLLGILNSVQTSKNYIVRVCSSWFPLCEANTDAGRRTLDPIVRFSVMQYWALPSPSGIR
jgi:hypothetical protein